MSINTNSHTVTVIFDDAQTTVTQMEEALTDEGYPPQSARYVHTTITSEDAANMMNSQSELFVIDVREASAFCDEAGHILHAVSYPWNSGALEESYDAGLLPSPDTDILVVDADGTQSGLAASFLDTNGFTSVYETERGMAAWEGITVACCSSFGLEGIISALQVSVNVLTVISDTVARDVDGDGKIGVAEAVCILEAISEADGD